MSYVDAIHSRHKDVIEVVERTNGRRVFKTLPVNHVFYYTDPNGTHRSIFGDRLKKFSSNNGKLFSKEYHRLSANKYFESDINPVFRCLEENYLNADTPALNIAFFDIETDFDPNKGFAPTTDPFNRITAISVYQLWSETLITLVMAPNKMADADAEAITAKFENCFLFTNEAEMLEAFFHTIDDADVLTGWNSTGYDIPYMVNRIEMVCGKEANRNWCLWDQLPRRREYIKFKKKSVTYDLVGRVHLDYLELYQKHNPQQLHSYKLDFVGEFEVGENKTAYEGTLDQLYNNDFEKFIEYNRQDVVLLMKIDKKKKFIELANQIAHTNTVLLKTTMGSVALIEQSITNYAHSLGLIIPDRKAKVETTDDDIDDIDDGFDDDEDDDFATKGKVGAVGAYVAKPKTGLQDEVGCCDINSLYPSTLRALNMSPETLIGHIRPSFTNKMIEDRITSGVAKSDLWEGVFCTIEYDMIRTKTSDNLTVDFTDGTHATQTAAEWYDYIFNNSVGVSISANGTLFSTDTLGLIPGLLAQWYSQRKEMQAREKTWDKLAGKGISLEGLEL